MAPRSTASNPYAIDAAFAPLLPGSTDGAVGGGSWDTADGGGAVICGGPPPCPPAPDLPPPYGVALDGSYPPGGISDIGVVDVAI